MCGIAGLYHFDSEKPINEKKLIEMRDILHHRGPDGAGYFIDNNVGLAHRRLSILDLSENGKQPFISEDGRYSITFNGEIYNYREFIPDLLQRGITLKSTSDTEVLLNLYIIYGQAILNRLNGMWAFAIWDKKEQTLFASRDRIGVKPFYYTVYDNSFYFGSEHKALFAAGVPKEFDNDCLEELLLFNYIAGENTVFKGIKRLLPGYSIQIQDSKITFTQWWNLSDKIKANRENIPKNPYEWFEETFYSSVAYRTISDVPVGVMLSGGLDSGSVAAALYKNNEKNLSAFNVGFDEKEYNESFLAKIVADKFNLNFHSIKIEGDQLFNSLLDATFFHDEPLIHQNDAQMLALSHYAKKFVKVLLSGEGGDEFMGGYVRYKPLNYYKFIKMAGYFSKYLKNSTNGGIVNRFDKLHRYSKGNSISEMILLNASSVYPNDFKNLGFQINLEAMEYRYKVLKEAKDLYPNEPARQAMHCDLFIHMASVLDRNDRMTMGAGIECRVPFMDYRLMEMVPALPSNYLLRGKKGKFLLFNSIGKQLPKEVLNFKKLGFSVPWEKYIKNDKRFLEIIEEIKNGSLRDILGKFRVDEIFNEKGINSHINKIFIRQLIILQLWKKVYLDSPSI